MPAGLQCWDETGKLIVDIGDYNTRYLGRVSGYIPANTPSYSIPFPAATVNGCFAIIVESIATPPNPPNPQPYTFAARALNGSILIIRIASNKAVTLTLDVYAFI